MEWKLWWLFLLACLVVGGLLGWLTRRQVGPDWCAEREGLRVRTVNGGIACIKVEVIPEP